MNCPPAIAKVLSQILETGILRIRTFGWQNDANGCAREADHIHNLPSLLIDFSPERLLYYWQVERRRIVEEGASGAVDTYGPSWKTLEKLLPATNRLLDTVHDVKG